MEEIEKICDAGLAKTPSRGTHGSGVNYKKKRGKERERKGGKGEKKGKKEGKE